MYSIELTVQAERFLEKLSQVERERILKRIYSIREQPFSFLKKLHGNRFWRLRIDDYRAIVDVVVVRRKIIVLRIGHRRNVYD
jgi:mRNA interferase RelE/StbE